ncbi:unnamed protein product, partial [Chrysoparadoxa australica]
AGYRHLFSGIPGGHPHLRADLQHPDRRLGNAGRVRLPSQPAGTGGYRGRAVRRLPAGLPAQRCTADPNAVDSLDPGNACNSLDALGILGPVCDTIAGTQESLTEALGFPTLEGLGGATLAGSQRALPDFVTAYRGGTPGEIRPGQSIHGYERLKNLTTSFNFTRLRGGASAPLGADQFILLFAVATYWLPDLPDKRDLQFEAQGTLTH